MKGTLRELNRSVEALLRDFPTMFRYPEPRSSQRQCPKCKAKMVRIADRRYGDGWEQALFQCAQCDNAFADIYRVRPIRVPCPDCGSDKDIRRKRRKVMNGRVVSLFQCQECGRTFQDLYQEADYHRPAYEPLGIICGSLGIPTKGVSRGLLKKRVSEALNERDMLTEREKIILQSRFAPKNGRTWSLAELGKMFDVSRERVRQIEAKALSKLSSTK